MPINATMVAQSSGGQPSMVTHITQQTDVFDTLMSEHVPEDGASTARERRQGLCSRDRRLSHARSDSPASTNDGRRSSPSAERTAWSGIESRQRNGSGSASASGSLEQTISDGFGLGREMIALAQIEARFAIALDNEEVAGRQTVFLPGPTDAIKGRCLPFLKSEVPFEDDRLSPERHGAETDEAGTHFANHAATKPA